MINNRFFSWDYIMNIIPTLRNYSVFEYNPTTVYPWETFSYFNRLKDAWKHNCPIGRLRIVMITYIIIKEDKKYLNRFHGFAVHFLEFFLLGLFDNGLSGPFTISFTLKHAFFRRLILQKGIIAHT